MKGLAVALLALAAGCRAPVSTAPPRSEPSAPAAQVERARAPATVRRASGEVCVRLTRWSPAQAVTIVGGMPGEVKIERRGARLLSNGSDAGVEVVLTPRNEALRLGEHAYAGRVRVRVDPAGKGLEVSNLVDLEDYVAGVLAGELVLWSADLETLRAQAIASRSYAVAALDERGRKRNEPYLFDDAREQVYGGRLVPKNARERELVKQLARAIATTRGVVLMEDDRVVDARFHAACGGSTADGRVIFPETAHECLQPVACAPCRGEIAGAREASSGTSSASSTWTWSATRAVLDQLAQRWKLGRHVTSLEPTKSDASGRWLEVEVTGDASSRRVPFEELRRALGVDKLPSSAIARTSPRPGQAIASDLVFEGRGRGHGVGLCQAGARGYAAAGWSAERILDHYYPGARPADFR
jgi:stage II sporulation protein D